VSDFRVTKLPLTLVTSFETPSIEPELPPKDHLPKHGTNTAHRHSRNRRWQKSFRGNNEYFRGLKNMFVAVIYISA
jgi:hypothetical protein